LISLGDKFFCFCSIKAILPDTRGVAILVPLKEIYPSRRVFDKDIIFTPGATRSGLFNPSFVGPLLEKEGIVFLGVPEVRLSFMAPTVMTLGLIPGDNMVLEAGPLFPAATTTHIPLFTACSTALQRGSEEHGLFAGLPKDKFTIFVLYSFFVFIIQEIASIISEVFPLPLSSRTFTPNMDASGATP